jgi:hypothetical protein
MLFSFLRGRLPYSLVQLKTREKQELASLNGYLCALR